MKTLSKRETEVLMELSQGFRSRDISDRLNIDEKTISTYILRIKTKIGIPRDSNIYLTVKKGLEYLKLLNDE